MPDRPDDDRDQVLLTPSPMWGELGPAVAQALQVDAAMWQAIREFSAVSERKVQEVGDG